MAPVVYLKAKPKVKKTSSLKLSLIHFTSLPRQTERFFLASLALIGLASIFFAISPFLIWQLSTLPRLTAKVDQAPIPQGQVLSAGTVLDRNVQVAWDPDGFSYFTTDYQPKEPRPEEFYLSIPKLKIEKAKAKVDSLRFDRHLSHFPGSSLPGEVGNAFVTGHSVLPQFNDPQNYRAIFTKLSDLEIGDEIFVDVPNQRLHFVVQYAKVVDPRDLSVLAPISPNGRNLTLMTCVPPGTNIKRLVIITSLI